MDGGLIGELLNSPSLDITLANGETWSRCLALDRDDAALLVVKDEVPVLVPWAAIQSIRQSPEPVDLEIDL